MKDTEWIIKQVDASMAMEGMPHTSRDKDRIRFCVGDNQKVESTVQDLVRQYVTESELKYNNNFAKIDMN